MMYSRVFSILLCGIFALSIAQADSVKPLDQLVLIDSPGDSAEGMVVSPNTDVTAWDAPPSGPFNTFGNQVGKLPKTEAYKVTESNEVPSIFGNQLWLRLSPLNSDPDSPCSTGECWAYQGKPGSYDGNFGQF